MARKALTYKNKEGDFQSILTSIGAETYAKLRERLPAGATNIVNTWEDQITIPETVASIETKLDQDLSSIAHTDADGNEFTFTETLQNRFMHKITLNRTFNWPSNTGIVSLTIPKARAIAEAVDDIMDAILIQSVTDKAAL